ncbi:MAG: hypothetical protein JWN46_2823 [Acidimicrobiales bacterium]|nr:hypothetical protein [Acidimicrobiales bacterium]
MAKRPPDELVFDEDDLAPAVDRMAAMAEHGSGWVNFLPEVPEDAEVPRGGGLFTIFTARGPAVPLATWTPASRAKPDARMEMGIEHGSGPQALARLAEHQLALPPGWRKRSDHPKRGLVVDAPGTTDLDDALWWLLAASHVLARAPLTGEWLAQLHDRSPASS